MKVLLRTPLSCYSGYGADGIGLAKALMRAGADVYLQATNVDAPLPQDVANLLTKELTAPFDLYINHIDPSALDCPQETAANADLSVAWTMWEYSNLLNLPKPVRKTLRQRLTNFDAFVGYSDVDPDCFRPYYDGPIFIQQGGFDPSGWPYMFDRDWDCKEFYFFMLGVLSERKDPWRAIEAFRLAKTMDPEFDRWARLSLKTTAPGLHHKVEDLFRQEDADGKEFTSLRIFYDIWPTELVRQFYKVQHCLISPSRGEGKNVPALEFMSTGGTAIATNWAGHTQWLDPAYSYPLDYTLEPVDTDSPNTLNARASIEHLAELMVHVFRNRNEAQEKGRLAAKVIPQAHNWDAVLEKLLLKLRTAVPEKGERLWTLAQIAKTNVR